MKLKDWFVVYLPLPFLVLLDWYTKDLALHYSQGQEGPFGPFYLIYNRGALFGYYSDLPQFLSLTFLSTVGVMGLGLFFFFQYMIRDRNLKLRIGLSIVMGGILGNVIDRIRFGSIVDFMKIEFQGWASPIFNVADSVQWVGYFLIAYAMYQNGYKPWPKTWRRRSIWVHTPIQRKLSLLLSAMVLIFSSVFTVFCYTFITVTLKDTNSYISELTTSRIETFIMVMAGLGILFSVMTYFLGCLLSHRILGPIYGFERFLRESLKGNHTKFKVRTDAEFKHLEPFAEEISTVLLPLIPPPAPAPAPESNQ